MQRENHMEQWKKDVKELFDEFKNKNGIIGYWVADAFILGIIRNMKDIHSLIKKNEIDDAIAMLSWLIAFMTEIYVDDSSTGCMYDYFCEVNEICEKLFDTSNEAKQKIIVELKKLKNKVNLYFIEEEYFGDK